MLKVISSFEIKCDVSGLSDRHSGEAIVAKFGLKDRLLVPELSTKLTYQIRRDCKERSNKSSLYTIYYKDGYYCLNKKLPITSKGKACSQVTTYFNSKKRLKLFILSSDFKKFYIDTDFDTYINYYLTNNAYYSLTKNDFTFSASKPIINATQNFFSDKLKKNIVIGEEENINAILFYCLEREDVSHTIYVGDSSKIELSFSNCSFTKNDITLITNAVHNILVFYENLKIMKTLNISQISDFLYNSSKSIEMNLKTIQVLSDTLKNSRKLFSSGRKINPRIEQIINHSIDNIDYLVIQQNRFLNLLDKQTKTK